MIAVISRTKDGYAARYERHLKHPVRKVWASLTENGRLAEWFPELRIEELRKGGIIQFDMGNGTFEEMAILDYDPYSVLEYTWAKDKVRFELYPEPEGCKLVLIESIVEVTDHTPRDLAGWHVCLDVIAALLDGGRLESRKAEWEKVYPEYVAAVAEAAGERS